MANAWDVLLQNAQPGNQAPVMVPKSEDFDSLYGLNEQPGDSDATKFAKSLQSAMLRNSAQGRETSQELIKSKLAAQMQIQVAQAQKQLEQQYPTYQAHMTPWGGILSFNPTTGATTEAYAGDPEAKEAFSAKYAAEAAKDKFAASPEGMALMKNQEQAKLDLTKAQTGEANAMAAIRPAQALSYERRGIPEPKPWTTEDDQRVQESVYERNGYGKGTLARQIDATGKKAQALQPLVDQAIAQARAARQQEIAQYRTNPGGGPRGAAAPQSSGEVPDLSDLLNPINQ